MSDAKDNVTALQFDALRTELTKRLAGLQQLHQSKLAERTALVTSIADSQERLRSLEIEIAGVEGHGAEAELCLALVTGRAAESGGDSKG